MKQRFPVKISCGLKGSFIVRLIVFANRYSCIQRLKFQLRIMYMYKFIQSQCVKCNINESYSVFPAKGYVRAILAPVAFFGSFYFIAFIVLFVTWCRSVWIKVHFNYIKEIKFYAFRNY